MNDQQIFSKINPLNHNDDFNFNNQSPNFRGSKIRNKDYIQEHDFKAQDFDNSSGSPPPLYFSRMQNDLGGEFSSNKFQDRSGSKKKLTQSFKKSKKLASY